MQNKPTIKRLEALDGDQGFKLRIVSFFIPVQMPQAKPQSFEDSGRLKILFLSVENIHAVSEAPYYLKHFKVLLDNEECFRAPLGPRHQDHKSVTVWIESRSKARLQMRVVEWTFGSTGWRLVDSLLGEDIEIVSLLPHRETYREVEINSPSEMLVRVLLCFTPAPKRKPPRR